MSEMTSQDRVSIPIDLTERLKTENCASEVALQIGPDSRLYSLCKDGALGAEQLRMLQARVMELRTEHPFKHLLITSAIRGEGKTHVASNLALILATQGNLRILLIDTDIRNPSVHRAFGISNSQGFKDWLLNGKSPWKAIQKIKRRNLYVMTAGAANLESLGPSDISCLQARIGQIESAFDLVLLDSPPVLGTVDARLLSAVANAVLLVVKSGSTPRNLVSQAQESLKGGNILGVVLNRIDPRHASFATYYHQNGSIESNGGTKGEKT